METVVRIIEINPRELARAAEEHNKPCTCLSCSLHRAAWIEDVDVEVEGEGTDSPVHHFKVEHSYPEGIDIQPWVARVIEMCAPQGAAWTLKLKRVPPKK